MTELKHSDPGTRPFDREIKLRGVLAFGSGVVLAIVLFSAVVWWVSIYLRDQRIAEDPAPSVMPEARQPYQPPGPRLQDQPEEELAALRAEEDALLARYEWVDEGEDLAQIPVERAMEILAAEAAVTGRLPAVGSAATRAEEELEEEAEATVAEEAAE